MPSVDENRLKGNWGAFLVASRMAGFCLVRPVAGDSDVGVDLFCESVENKKAFLHFWVQVKTGDQCKINGDGVVSCYFDKPHLEYWLRQPVPVYAALVPGEPGGQDPDIHIIDVTARLLEAGIKQDQAGQSLAAQYCWPTRDFEAVRAFLATQVPTTTSLLRVREGVLAPTPAVEESYFNAVPLHPIGRHRDAILTQLRRTPAFSVLSLKVSGEWGEETASFRRHLVTLLEQFDDDQHWETHGARAFSYHLDLQFTAAAEQYHRALDIIERDPETDGVEDWEYRVIQLQHDLELAEQGLPLNPRGPA
jgi:hypothetical protein